VLTDDLRTSLTRHAADVTTPPDLVAAVEHRATRIRLRRKASLGTGLAAAVAVAVAVPLALAGGSRTGATLQPATPTGDGGDPHAATLPLDVCSPGPATLPPGWLSWPCVPATAGAASARETLERSLPRDHPALRHPGSRLVLLDTDVRRPGDCSPACPGAQTLTGWLVWDADDLSTPALLYTTSDGEVGGSSGPTDLTAGDPAIIKDGYGTGGEQIVLTRRDVTSVRLQQPGELGGAVATDGHGYAAVPGDGLVHRDDRLLGYVGTRQVADIAWDVEPGDPTPCDQHRGSSLCPVPIPLPSLAPCPTSAGIDGTDPVLARCQADRDRVDPGTWRPRGDAAVAATLLPEATRLLDATDAGAGWVYTPLWAGVSGGQRVLVVRGASPARPGSTRLGLLTDDGTPHLLDAYPVTAPYAAVGAALPGQQLLVLAAPGDEGTAYASFPFSPSAMTEARPRLSDGVAVVPLAHALDMTSDVAAPSQVLSHGNVVSAQGILGAPKGLPTPAPAPTPAPTRVPIAVSAADPSTWALRGDTVLASRLLPAATPLLQRVDPAAGYRVRVLWAGADATDEEAVVLGVPATPGRSLTLGLVHRSGSAGTQLVSTMDIGAAGSVSWPVVGAALAGGRVLVLAAPGVTSAYYSPGDQALTLLGGLRLVDGVTVVDDPQLAKPSPRALVFPPDDATAADGLPVLGTRAG